MKQGEKKGAKRRGDRNRKSNGGKQSKGKPQNRSKASKASKCVSETKNSWKGSTDELEVTGKSAEVRTGRGSAGLVRGEMRCRADETSRKGKGKGNGGKGEHEGKGGGFGHNGKQQETRERGGTGPPPGHVGSGRERWRKVMKKRKRF